MQKLKIQEFITRTIMSLKDKPLITRKELNETVFEELIKKYPLIGEDYDSWYQYICELTEKLEPQIS